MSTILVTGAGGFVGSTLAIELRAAGHDVAGVDAVTDYYDRAQKEANLADLAALGVQVDRRDLAHEPVEDLVEGVDVVHHLAGQPGVRRSWASGFARYNDDNILATQRLLEAARAASTGRFVYASSSSVYGNATGYPTLETDLPRPHSPYGVTKLAAEHLCNLYADVHGVPTVSLRLFTVFGPRQRPDMAMHRLFEAVLDDEPFSLFGDGSAVRDFTFVDDVVSAFVAAGEAPVPSGTVCNVAGGNPVVLQEVLDLVGEIAGRPVRLDRRGHQAGDVDRTGGSIERIGEVLGWKPVTPLRRALEQQYRWHLRRRGAG